MKSRGLILRAAIATVLLGLAFLLLHQKPTNTTAPTQPPSSPPAPQGGSVATPANSTASQHAVSSIPPLPGDALLADFGSQNYSPKRDLDCVARVMDAFLLLSKPNGRFPLADNQDWSAALKGKSAYREPFVSETNRVFNSRGRLADRWGHDLFLHALGGGRFDVRSAGPDGKLWTEDDIQRDADGSFLQATNLNPASLWKR